MRLSYNRQCLYLRACKGIIMKDDIKNFLKSKGVLAEDIDLHAGLEDFLEQMRDGLNGNKGLKMIPTYVKVGAKIPTNEKIIVLDAGGTNFRVCTLYFDDDMVEHVESFMNYPMPGSQGELSKEEFFQTIVDYIEPVVNESSTIGFCFSYAADIQPNGDGVILNFAKEVRVPEVVGEKLGENILATLKARGLKHDHHIVVINDTSAALLGGYNVSRKHGYDSNLGYILGTGTNTAYVEDVNKIVKIHDKIPASERNAYMIINTESGDYTPKTLSELDNEIDAGTADPGTYRFEKMISGRYQGLQALYLIREAIEENSGLFSTFFCERFEDVHDVKSKDLDDFLYMPYGQNVLSRCCANVVDRENLYYIIDNIYERAARLSAINLAAVMTQANAGKSPVRPVAITADGTTFYKSKLFRPKLSYYVRTFINDELHRYCEFIKVDNANLIGAAIAGLTN